LELDKKFGNLDDLDVGIDKINKKEQEELSEKIHVVFNEYSIRSRSIRHYFFLPKILLIQPNLLGLSLLTFILGLTSTSVFVSFCMELSLPIFEFYLAGEVEKNTYDDFLCRGVQCFSIQQRVAPNRFAECFCFFLYGVVTSHI